MIRGKLLRVIYIVYPPFLRVLEKFRIHSGRQEYLIGILHSEKTHENLKKHLLSNDFEDAILAWRDNGEILSMRKIDNEIFQYHLRLFEDGEIRCHYEYSSEGSPWKHVREIGLEPRIDHFQDLLGDYLE